jgi:predicted MFS family arabinose efflux permease
MPPATQRTLLTICALLAVTAAVVFLAISIDSEIYAPGAGSGHLHAGLGVYEKLTPRVQNDLSERRVLRKIYSVVAFAIVGLLVAPFTPKDQRIVACTALLTVYSLVIEVAQKLVLHASEGLLSNAFDIGCGALGGCLGALAFNRLSRVVSGRTRAR